jgi:hypothetical protein
MKLLRDHHGDWKQKIWHITGLDEESIDGKLDLGF